MTAKKITILLILCLFGWASAVWAETIYVSGITKITMRTGPGVEHKIVAMLVSGTKLDIMEYKRDWSRVRTSDDKNGWVLTRFLTQEPPLTLQVQNLKQENQRLQASLKQSRDTNQDLTQKNTELNEIEKKFHKLEQASADFLKLDAKYQALLKLSKDQKLQIESLEENLNNEEILWFLSGAGVFIVGLILGLSTRKKKRNSLL